MHRFSVIPANRSGPVAVFEASNAGAVLAIAQRLSCKQADVLRDGEYSFSAYLKDNGLWCIYPRGPAMDDQVVPLVGQSFSKGENS
jgi:hypothetical protein